MVWFVNKLYFSALRKSVGGFKVKIVSLFKKTQLDKLCMSEDTQLTSKIWTKQNVKNPYISEDNKKI